MNERKNMWVLFGSAISVSLIASSVAVWLLSYHYSRLQFDLLNTILGKVAEREPEVQKIISAVLKEYTESNLKNVSENAVLSALGYRVSDFSDALYGQNALFVSAGILTGILLFLFTFFHQNHLQTRRIQALTDYLEQVNSGKPIILSTSGEDDFSKLEDEIYKTVTFLCQTKEEAVQTKKNFADNLSNIAHQIKTPITAISLSLQTADLKQAEKHLLRLTRLEEALLVLARIDAGTLILRKKKSDVFTLLVLAADNLQELLTDSGVYVDIPELSEMAVNVDLDWTMEAIINLMKNCMEHGSGTIHCSYARNPLYTEILIWDEGPGFKKEELSHVFERFYRGKNAAEGSIGIGLSLAKELIERQNGTIRAGNKPGGGALFEIRFYSH